MKLKWTAAGMTAALIAMCAAAPAAFAQSSDTIILAQAVDEAALAEAQAIIAEAGNLQSLSEDDLKDRVIRIEARILDNHETRLASLGGPAPRAVSVVSWPRRSCRILAVI